MATRIANRLLNQGILIAGAVADVLRSLFAAANVVFSAVVSNFQWILLISGLLGFSFLWINEGASDNVLQAVELQWRCVVQPIVDGLLVLARSFLPLYEELICWWNALGLTNQLLGTRLFTRILLECERIDLGAIGAQLLSLAQAISRSLRFLFEGWVNGGAQFPFYPVLRELFAVGGLTGDVIGCLCGNIDVVGDVLRRLLALESLACALHHWANAVFLAWRDGLVSLYGLLLELPQILGNGQPARFLELLRAVLLASADGSGDFELPRLLATTERTAAGIAYAALFGSDILATLACTGVAEARTGGFAEPATVELAFRACFADPGTPERAQLCADFTQSEPAFAGDPQLLADCTQQPSARLNWFGWAGALLQLLPRAFGVAYQLATNLGRVAFETTMDADFDPVNQPGVRFTADLWQLDTLWDSLRDPLPGQPPPLLDPAKTNAQLFGPLEASGTYASCNASSYASLPSGASTTDPLGCAECTLEGAQSLQPFTVHWCQLWAQVDDLLQAEVGGRRIFTALLCCPVRGVTQVLVAAAKWAADFGVNFLSGFSRLIGYAVDRDKWNAPFDALLGQPTSLADGLLNCLCEIADTVDPQGGLRCLCNVVVYPLKAFGEAARLIVLVIPTLGNTVLRANGSPQAQAGQPVLFEVLCLNTSPFCLGDDSQLEGRIFRWIRQPRNRASVFETINFVIDGSSIQEVVPTFQYLPIDPGAPNAGDNFLDCLCFLISVEFVNAYLDDPVDANDFPDICCTVRFLVRIAIEATKAVVELAVAASQSFVQVLSPAVQSGLGGVGSLPTHSEPPGTALLRLIACDSESGLCSPLPEIVSDLQDLLGCPCTLLDTVTINGQGVPCLCDAVEFLILGGVGFVRIGALLASATLQTVKCIFTEGGTTLGGNDETCRATVIKRYEIAIAEIDGTVDFFAQAAGEFGCALGLLVPYTCLDRPDGANCASPSIDVYDIDSCAATDPVIEVTDVGSVSYSFSSTQCGCSPLARLKIALRSGFRVVTNLITAPLELVITILELIQSSIVTGSVAPFDIAETLVDLAQTVVADVAETLWGVEPPRDLLCNLILRFSPGQLQQFLDLVGVPNADVSFCDKPPAPSGFVQALGLAVNCLFGPANCRAQQDCIGDTLIYIGDALRLLSVCLISETDIIRQQVGNVPGPAFGTILRTRQTPGFLFLFPEFFFIAVQPATSSLRQQGPTLAAQLNGLVEDMFERLACILDVIVEETFLLLRSVVSGLLNFIVPGEFGEFFGLIFDALIEIFIELGSFILKAIKYAISVYQDITIGVKRGSAGGSAGSSSSGGQPDSDELEQLYNDPAAFARARGIAPDTPCGRLLRQRGDAFVRYKKRQADLNTQEQAEAEAQEQAASGGASWLFGGSSSSWDEREALGADEIELSATDQLMLEACLVGVSVPLMMNAQHREVGARKGGGGAQHMLDLNAFTDQRAFGRLLRDSFAAGRATSTWLQTGARPVGDRRYAHSAAAVPPERGRAYEPFAAEPSPFDLATLTNDTQRNATRRGRHAPWLAALEEEAPTALLRNITFLEYAQQSDPEGDGFVVEFIDDLFWRDQFKAETGEARRVRDAIADLQARRGRERERRHVGGRASRSERRRRVRPAWEPRSFEDTGNSSRRDAGAAGERVEATARQLSLTIDRLRAVKGRVKERMRTAIDVAQPSEPRPAPRPERTEIDWASLARQTRDGLYAAHAPGLSGIVDAGLSRFEAWAARQAAYAQTRILAHRAGHALPIAPNASAPGPLDRAPRLDTLLRASRMAQQAIVRAPGRAAALLNMRAKGEDTDQAQGEQQRRQGGNGADAHGVGRRALMQQPQQAQEYKYFDPGVPRCNETVDPRDPCFDCLLLDELLTEIGDIWNTCYQRELDNPDFPPVGFRGGTPNTAIRVEVVPYSGGGAGLTGFSALDAALSPVLDFVYGLIFGDIDVLRTAFNIITETNVVPSDGFVGLLAVVPVLTPCDQELHTQCNFGIGAEAAFAFAFRWTVLYPAYVAFFVPAVAQLLQSVTGLLGLAGTFGVLFSYAAWGYNAGCLLTPVSLLTLLVPFAPPLPVLPECAYRQILELLETFLVRCLFEAGIGPLNPDGGATVPGSDSCPACPGGTVDLIDCRDLGFEGATTAFAYQLSLDINGTSADGLAGAFAALAEYLRGTCLVRGGCFLGFGRTEGVNTGVLAGLLGAPASIAGVNESVVLSGGGGTINVTQAQLDYCTTVAAPAVIGQRYLYVFLLFLILAALGALLALAVLLARLLQTGWLLATSTQPEPPAESEQAVDPANALLQRQIVDMRREARRMEDRMAQLEARIGAGGAG